MTQKAEDQSTADAKLLLPTRQGRVDTVDDGRKRDAPGSMGLGVKEDLGMHHIILLATHEVGPGQIVKILLGAKHGCTLIVEIKKRLQVIKLIGFFYRLDIGIGKGNAITGSQMKHHLRFKCALNVHM